LPETLPLRVVLISPLILDKPTFILR
jgi:hypothetical protein